MKLSPAATAAVARPPPAGSPGRASRSSAWETDGRAAGPAGWRSTRPCRRRPPSCRNSSWRRPPAAACSGRRKPSWIARASSASQVRVLRPWACRWPISLRRSLPACSTARSTLVMACPRRAIKLAADDRTGGGRQHLAVNRRPAGLGLAEFFEHDRPRPLRPAPCRVRLRSKGRLDRGPDRRRRRRVLLAGGSGRFSCSAARVPVAPTSMASALPRRMIWKASPRAMLAAASRRVSELFGPRRSL